jgi:NAD(P)-dependent dehydrogenase (short-subunit alcohol dehydrogenase family)
MGHVVITGSTRGIGRGLAESFLKQGWKVTINGRTESSVNRAVEELNSVGREFLCAGLAGDASCRDDLQALWDFAAPRAPIDVWINNAGMDQSRANLWELPEKEITTLVNLNLLGTMNGIAVAVRGMMNQNRNNGVSGRIYNMEGFGSNGMMRPGMTLYGTSKYAISYLTKSAGKECAGLPVKIGSISPGMVRTDLLLSGIPSDPVEAAQTRKIFDILADPVERVTPWIVKQIVVKGSMKISWLTTAKSTWRFLTAPFRIGRSGE